LRQHISASEARQSHACAACDSDTSEYQLLSPSHLLLAQNVLLLITSRLDLVL